MKSYILRELRAVQPQKSARPSRSKPGSEPAGVAPSKPALFTGLDVHNDTIAVSLAPSASTEVRRYGIIGGQHDDVLRLLKKLSAAHPEAELRCCYEAGPRGYPLCRFIRSQGADATNT